METTTNTTNTTSTTGSTDATATQLAPVAPVKAQNGSELKQYLDTAGDLPGDVLLGRLVLYTISDEPVAHDTLDKWFTELGLNKAFLPNPLRELDAFKKATSEVNNRSYTLSGDRTAHLLCREVSTTPDMVIRHITREIKDSRKKRLQYSTAIEARYFRKTRKGGTGRIKLRIQREDPAGGGNHVLPEEEQFVRDVAQEIAQSFGQHSQFHDGQKMRALVRNYLLHLNAIEVKASTYFGHFSADAELAALAELVNRLGGRSSMNMIPLVDLKRERAFITSVFEREAAESLTKIGDSVKEMLAQDRVTPAALARVKEQYDTVLKRAQEHMSRLEVTQDLTAATAEVTHELLLKLHEKVAA